MSSLTFANIVDIDQIRKLLEAHFKFTGIGAGILDADENILVAVGYSDICFSFHRIHPVAELHCRESDTYIKAHLHDCVEGYLDYRCKNGLVDVAMPIIINGVHLATFFTGQFFYNDDKPEVEYFRAQAEKFGFDEAEYLEALGRVPVYSREHVRDMIDYFRNLVEIITGMGLKNLELSREAAERKKSERRIALMSFALDHVHEAAYLADEHGRFIYVNEGACRILGYGYEEFLDMNVADIDPDHQLERWPEHCHDIRTNGPLTFETRHKTREGRIFPVELTASTFEYEGRDYALALARDITGRKQLEEKLRLAHDELEKRVEERTEQLEKTAEALRISEERYALAVQGSNDGIWDLNLVTGEAYYSSRWKNIIGCDEGEIAANFREWESRLHPDDHQSAVEACLAYVEGRTTAFNIEYRLRHKDGSYRWVLSRGVCLRDPRGRAYRMAGSLTDITERKELEHQLLQVQKMESIGMLAGGVAHEFNNLLTAISGYGQILQESIPEDDELARESITNVLKAAGRAADLTRGLLAFSRRQLISIKPVNINTLISNTAKIIQRVIGEDIEFSTGFSCKNLLVNADPGQIEQVLMNLATNSRDAMPHGGRLSIRTRRVVVNEGCEVRFDLPASGRFVLISVDDTGTGIDKKILEKIFEPFYTTKDVGKGTGLGLAIVHGIIKQHNGSILVSSEPGKGTTFDIYLPLAKGYPAGEESNRFMDGPFTSEEQ